MILLNFSHPISETQRADIERIAGQPIDRLIDIPVQFDNEAPFLDQILDLSDRLPLDSVSLQTLPILINLPSLNYIAAGLLVWLNGKMGYFPAIVRMRSRADRTPFVYEVAEIINLQALREQARKER